MMPTALVVAIVVLISTGGMRRPQTPLMISPRLGAEFYLSSMELEAS
jgi:hypothetical protein